MGTYAGLNLESNCICLGKFAGTSTNMPDNDTPIVAGSNNIFINATGDVLHTTESGGCYIKPLRSVTDVTGLFGVFYNNITGEMVYQTP